MELRANIQRKLWDQTARENFYMNVKEFMRLGQQGSRLFGCLRRGLAQYVNICRGLERRITHVGPGSTGRCGLVEEGPKSKCVYQLLDRSVCAWMRTPLVMVSLASRGRDLV